MSSASRNVILGLLFIGAVAFVIAAAIVIYQYELWTGSTDIYPTWQGAKLYWEDGGNPYDDAVGQESQRAIYEDGVADEGEDEFQFVYPFYLIFYIGPLALLEFKVAATIFMTLLLVLLGVSLALTLHTIGWLPKPLHLGLAILIYLTAYFSVRGLLLSQPALLAYGFHIAAYWGIARGHDRFAGAMLALSTIKPQTGYLIVPLLLLWAWFQYRRPLVFAFGSVFAALFAVSIVFLPTWFFDWIHRVFSYRVYTETIATVQIVTHTIDAIPEPVQFGAQLLVSGLILWPVAHFWRQAIFQGQSANFMWGLMLTMTASLLIAPRTATTYYVELYPAVVVFMLFSERAMASFSKIMQGSLMFAGVFGFVVAYWALHIATAPPIEDAGLEAPIVYVVFPSVVYVWLLWQRDNWHSIDIFKRQEPSI